MRGAPAGRGRRAGHRQGRGRLAADDLHRRARRARSRRSRRPTTSPATSSRGCRCCPAPPTCASSASARCRCASTSTARGSPAYKLTVQDVEDAIRRQNAEIPAGPHRVDGARVHGRGRDRRADARAVRPDHRRQRRRLSGAHPRRSAPSSIGALDERTISRYNGKPVAQHRRDQAGGGQSARAVEGACARRSRRSTRTCRRA